MKDDDLLTREQVAIALTAAGYPIAASTLATLASKGGGPHFEIARQKKGQARTVYRWGEAIAWMRARRGVAA